MHLRLRIPSDLMIVLVWTVLTLVFTLTPVLKYTLSERYWAYPWSFYLPLQANTPSEEIQPAIFIVLC